MRYSQKMFFAAVFARTPHSPNAQGEKSALTGLIIILLLLLNSCSSFRNYQLEQKLIDDADCSKLFMYHKYEKGGDFWYKFRQRTLLQIKQDSIISFSMAQVDTNPKSIYLFLDRYVLASGVLNLKTLQLNYVLLRVNIHDFTLCEKEIETPISHHAKTVNFIDSTTINGIKLYLYASNNSLDKNITHWVCEKYGYILGFNTSDSLHCQSYLADTFDENNNYEVQCLLDSIYVNYYHLHGFQTHEKVFDIDNDEIEGIGKVIRGDLAPTYHK